MNRDQKRQKKAAKRAAKRKSRAAGRHHGDFVEAPEVVALMSYEFTSEPLPDPAYDRLPESVKDQLDSIHNALLMPGTNRLAELLALIEQYPDVPQLYNFLYTTYQTLKKPGKARQVLEETLERFPDYLFGRIAYASTYLDNGETEPVPEIFDNCFELPLLYPERRRFHISEVLGFHATMARYFYMRGEREIAERYYDLMEQLEPDNPRTLLVRDMLALPRLGALFQQVLARKS